MNSLKEDLPFRRSRFGGSSRARAMAPVRLAQELTGREEGFTNGKALVAGRSVSPVLTKTGATV